MSRSRRRVVSSENEDSGAASSGYEEEEVDFDVFGNLKTHVIWDPQDNRLRIALRQYAETPRKLEFKLKANLDTVSGRSRVWGHVRKNFYTHVPSLQRLMVNAAQRERGGKLDEPGLDPAAWTPCGMRTLVLKDWTIAPGLAYDSAQPSHPLRYTLALRKNPQVLKSGDKVDLWLSAKSIAEVDARSMQVSAGAGVRLKVFRYNVTNKQDVKLSMGLDWEQGSRAGARMVTPYLKASEKNFGVKLQKGAWTLFYEAQQ